MPFDDDETGNPTDWRRVVWGLCGAAFAAYIAHGCFTTAEGRYSFWRYFGPRYTLHGDGAFAVGVLFVFAAVFLHFYYFWAFFPRLEPLRWLFTRISMVGFVVTTIYILLYIASHRVSNGNA